MVAFASSLDVLKPTTAFDSIESLAQLGQFLRNHRELKSYSREKVATDLKMREAHITALESGVWDDLPSEIYGRGYLRRYAQHLGFSGDEAAACCLRLLGKSEATLYYRKIEDAQTNPTKSLIIFGLFGFVAISVYWSYSQKQLLQVPERTAIAFDLPTSDFEPSNTGAHSCTQLLQTSLLPCWKPVQKAPSILLNQPFYPVWKSL